MIEGTISSMTDQPLVVAAGEAVTKRHITVNTNVTFQDLKLHKKMFEKQFSDWAITMSAAVRRNGQARSPRRLTSWPKTS